MSKKSSILKVAYSLNELLIKNKNKSRVFPEDCEKHLNLKSCSATKANLNQKVLKNLFLG